MGTYILRRLLLMIPTLIGITFLLFMLVALAPGGIGAALRVSGGGQVESGQKQMMEAYLEDRYGLGDPVPVQYVRWLGRISPIKFGDRAQVSLRGERVSAPKPIKDPVAWKWFVEELPGVPEVGHEWAQGASDEERGLIYAKALEEYVAARAASVGAAAVFEQEAARLLKDTGHADIVDFRNRIEKGPANRVTPDRTHELWPRVEELGQRMMAAYTRAQDARGRLQAVFAAKPFDEAGVPIIPGALYVDWPDFGVSMTRGQPVLDLIGNRLPVTLLVNCIAFPIIYLIAIPGGMLAAVKQGKWQDTLLGGLFVAFWSVPIVWAGVLAAGYLANDRYLGWFPVAGLHSNDSDRMLFLPSFTDGFKPGFVLDTLWHLVLPVACLVYGGFAVLSKQTRAAMLDNFNADYVRTAKAKGVASNHIIFRHVFRNSLLPLITMFATVFPAMLSGSVVIERIFSIPGMGSLAIEAIYLRDRELLLANALMIAAVNLFALLLADILYAIADPRISYK